MKFPLANLILLMCQAIPPGYGCEESLIRNAAPSVEEIQSKDLPPTIAHLWGKAHLFSVPKGTKVFAIDVNEKMEREGWGFPEGFRVGSELFIVSYFREGSIIIHGKGGVGSGFYHRISGTGKCIVTLQHLPSKTGDS